MQNPEIRERVESIINMVLSRDSVSLDDIRDAILALLLRERQEATDRAVRERDAYWVEMLQAHKAHCSTKGQTHLTEVKNNAIGKHLIKWKLLFETLANAVREEVAFPGETNDGRCPKCDEQVPCAYCIASVEPMEAQEQILSASKTLTNSSKPPMGGS
jgi:hypothetical protein